MNITASDDDIKLVRKKIMSRYEEYVICSCGTQVRPYYAETHMKSTLHYKKLKSITINEPETPALTTPEPDVFICDGQINISKATTKDLMKILYTYQKYKYSDRLSNKSINEARHQKGREICYSCNKEFYTYNLKNHEKSARHIRNSN